MAWMTSRDRSYMRGDVSKLLPGTAIIQSMTEVIDSQGRSRETWTAKSGGTVACRLDPISQQTGENIEYSLSRELLVTEYVLTVPHDAPLTRDDRVSIASEIYEVVRLSDVHSNNVSKRAVVNYVGITAGTVSG